MKLPFYPIWNETRSLIRSFEFPRKPKNEKDFTVNCTKEVSLAIEIPAHSPSHAQEILEEQYGPTIASGCSIWSQEEVEEAFDPLVGGEEEGQNENKNN